jgi:hypothetical protein
LSTKICETIITVPNISIVIDSGIDQEVNEIKKNRLSLKDGIPPEFFEFFCRNIPPEFAKRRNVHENP